MQALIDDGAFLNAVVASRDGLPLATVGTANTAMIAAVAAAMKDLAERAHQGLTEITTRDDVGHMVVSRYFSVDADFLLLAVQLPTRHTYRRLTNKAIKEIKMIWSD